MAFPTPFAGVAALSPLTAASRRPVGVLVFDDGTEQRFVQSAGLTRFVLELSEISTDEKQQIVDFFETSKGSFDATWSIVIDAASYDFMAFADDTIAPQQTSAGVWSMTLNLVQTRKN